MADQAPIVPKRNFVAGTMKDVKGSFVAQVHEHVEGQHESQDAIHQVGIWPTADEAMKAANEKVDQLYKDFGMS